MRTQTKTTPQNTLKFGEFVGWIHVFVDVATKIYALAALELLKNRTTRLKVAGCNRPSGIGSGTGNSW